VSSSHYRCFFLCGARSRVPVDVREIASGASFQQLQQMLRDGLVPGQESDDEEEEEERRSAAADGGDQVEEKKDKSPEHES
jgi:hypothetical protein